MYQQSTCGLHYPPQVNQQTLRHKQETQRSNKKLDQAINHLHSYLKGPPSSKALFSYKILQSFSNADKTSRLTFLQLSHPQPLKIPSRQSHLKLNPLLCLRLPQQAITNPTIPQPPAWPLPCPCSRFPGRKGAPLFQKRNAKKREKKLSPGGPTKGVYNQI